MDSNDDYDLIVGPFIANFHLHHRIPKYKKHNILMVYFNELSSKVWLCGFMLIFLYLVCNDSWLSAEMKPIIFYGLFYFCILSSIAEVSHYLCHMSNSRVANFFMNNHILLNKKHHAKHHLDDNVNYAFLNGITDILINYIAHKFDYGYKNTTDKHYALYQNNKDSR